jgi:zinc and cadmium transporter
MGSAIIAAALVTLCALSGTLFFGARGHLTGAHRYIIPVAIGVFLGVVFFELLPETLAAGGTWGSLPVAAGFISFYLLSLVLHTYHHHHETDCDDDGCEDRAGASMLLTGDTIHNLADGIVIASAFLVSPAVGIATTVGIALHEIPQEIAEFGVLLRAGYTKTQATVWNLLSASSVIVGTIVTYAFASTLSGYLWVLTGLAAGNLLYIAASDLLPGVHEESRESNRSIEAFLATVIGMIAIVTLLALVRE